MMGTELSNKFINLSYIKRLLRTLNSELQTGLLTRRHFLRFLLGLPLLSSFPFRVQDTWADLPSPPKKERDSIGEFFKGEELHYEIGLWLFKKVAVGKISFEEMGKRGRYLATLQGETLGVLGFAARYRVDTYRSIMEEIDGGRRLRSISFEEDVKIGGKLRRRTHFLDYQKRKWIQVRQSKDGIKTRREEEIPPGMVYDDFVTASYNFRYGVYGGMERGRTYRVATFPKKGPSSYEVRVASKEEVEKKRKSEKSKEGKEFFLKFFLDAEMTHSIEGLIEGWLSKELYPIEGTIKDVIFFGDVKGTLIKKI
ncbi:MAG: DUF3108 domain-containing protein [Desulfobacterales bacterium]|nr:DUF3108 domain-containing protein [Desulfobacterales bacterium]